MLKSVKLFVFIILINYSGNSQVLINQRVDSLNEVLWSFVFTDFNEAEKIGDEVELFIYRFF